MGGKWSHEFHFLSPLGEDTLYACSVGGSEGCGYVANAELAKSRKNGSDGETSTESVAAGEGCPRCAEGTLVAHRAVELGHTFYLGTRYSEPLRAVVAVEREKGKTEEVPLSMGCHGIGVSRMIGAVAAIMADAQGLNWPRVMAPWEVIVVPGPKATEGDVESVYDALQRQDGEDIVIDDRADSLISKLKDADLIGYPVILVLGKAWERDRLVEVQCRRRGVKLEVQLNDLANTVQELLADL
ncbi:hypothetical protein FH972_022115 [Carpinus fangiana]|uniref:Anticodon-binding domain-containing protein n=1 Tax=Carpinus fangiana TaxID=176857 RepID=A0A5N6KRM8_9ROSI|nr:hypothetical protein FH972_022115 [Carpinus fangiana]